MIAEDLIFEERSSGAANDLEKASMIAREMVGSYGMSDRIGPINYKFG